MACGNSYGWRRTQVVLASLLAAALLGAMPVFLFRAWNATSGTDFHRYYAAGRYVLEHGTRQPGTVCYYYLPSLDAAWALVAWMPPRVAAVVYYFFGCVCWAGLLRSVGRYLLPFTPGEDRRTVLLWAALFTIVPAVGTLVAGAFHTLMVWLMVEGLGRLDHRRPSGAAFLGTAIWLKLLPGVAVVYLLLKRRWGAAGASLAVAVGLDAVLSLSAYGGAQAWALHTEWWKARAVGEVSTILTDPALTSARSSRNQSLPAVARRMLSRMAAGEQVTRRINVADLPPAALKVTYAAITLGLAGALAGYWRRRDGRVDPLRGAAEVALVVLSTLWFSPVLLSYHAIAALPSIAVVLGSRWERSWFKTAALVTWLAGVALLAIPMARAAGELLWAALILGAAVAYAGRHPEALVSSAARDVK